MSKFFYDGKANNNNERGSGQIGASKSFRLGSKKSPAQVTVKTEQRKQEISKIFAENKWSVDIKLDENQDENIKDLEFLQSNNVKTVTAPVAGRNDPCPCESGKKFKKCCGAQ